MRKCVRKCSRIGELAVMEMAQEGVITRARALEMARTTTNSGIVKRKKKVGGGKLRFTPSLIQLRSRRGTAVTTENSLNEMASVSSRRRSTANDWSSSPSSDHALVSCCSSNGSSELEDKSEFVDLEEQSVKFERSRYQFDCSERRETTPSSELRPESGDLESTAEPSDGNSRRKSTVEIEKMPSESDIEEFFALAEKDLQKGFTDKYNYDVVKDVPLEGRYEWVRLKP